MKTTLSILGSHVILLAAIATLQAVDRPTPHAVVIARIDAYIEATERQGWSDQRLTEAFVNWNKERVYGTDCQTQDNRLVELAASAMMQMVFAEMRR